MAAQRCVNQKRSPSSHGAVMQGVCGLHRTPQQAAAGLGNFEAAGSRDILRDLVHWNPDSNGCTEMCEPEKEPQ